MCALHEAPGDLAAPLCPGGAGDVEAAGTPAGDGGGGDRSGCAGAGAAEEGPRPRPWGQASVAALDAAASAVFWYALLVLDLPDVAAYGGLAALLLAMALWRRRGAAAAAKATSASSSSWQQGGSDAVLAELPYSCGFACIGGKELYLVATVHISPLAPRNVEAVISRASPQVVMIELDEERLDGLRDRPPEPKPEDFQQVKVLEEGQERRVLQAQRAIWNGEHANQLVVGRPVFDESNAHGVKPMGGEVQGQVAVVRRGSLGGEFAAFAFKAHIAARAGAAAVLVINQDDRLPTHRIGLASLWGEIKVAANSRSLSLPPIPLVLVTHTDGERLLRERDTVSLQLCVREDSYPRRSLPRRLCQACTLLGSGIGMLYGIIHCFAVEVGAEFAAAETVSAMRGIPCICIDVDMNRFWSRLGSSLLPTPRNLASSLLSWLALPRMVVASLFPARGNVDVLGSLLLHAASFRARTWIAFALAGFGASLVTTMVLKAMSSVPERVAEDAGAVHSEDRDQVQAMISLLLEFYALPQIYEAVAASRDEAMYQNIVRKSRETNAKRMVAVVGAAHTNGILQRARRHGL